MTFAIKFRKRGDRAWYFMRPDGGATRLRVHAGQYTQENARLAVAEYRSDPENAALEFKVARLYPEHVGS